MKRIWQVIQRNRETSRKFPKPLAQMTPTEAEIAHCAMHEAGTLLYLESVVRASLCDKTGWDV